MCNSHHGYEQSAPRYCPFTDAGAGWTSDRVLADARSSSQARVSSPPVETPVVTQGAGVSDVPGCVSWRSSQPRAGAGVPGVSSPLAGPRRRRPWWPASRARCRRSPCSARRCWGADRRAEPGGDRSGADDDVRHLSPLPIVGPRTARGHRRGPRPGGWHRPWPAPAGVVSGSPRGSTRRSSPRSSRRTGSRGARRRPSRPRIRPGRRSSTPRRAARPPSTRTFGGLRSKGAIKAPPGGCFRSASMGRAAGSSHGRSRSPP